jgi:signal transduction histidine kinase
LSVSHHTATDHGGRITVESGAIKGTVVRVFLPVAAVHNAIPAPNPAENSTTPSL